MSANGAADALRPDVTAYVFDLYGTLVDFTSLSGRFSPPNGDGTAFVRDWRQKQLAYAFAATLMNRYADFDTITAAAYRYAAQSHGLPYDDVTVATAMAEWSRLPAYVDAAATLGAARERGYKTAILSNGTPPALAATVAACGFADALDAVFSVDAVRAFKPHPAVYQLVVDHFGVAPGRIAFVSSNGWDATGAAEFGCRVFWCNRTNLPAETFGLAPYRTIASLSALFDA